MKRAPIALLAALVTAMALVAAGLVGDHFGFHNWPMSPGPQSAQHVTVSHPTLAASAPDKRAQQSSPATTAAESADNTLPADSARGTTRLVSQHTGRRTAPSVPSGTGNGTRRGSSGTANHHGSTSGDDQSNGGHSGGGGNGGSTTSTQATPAAPTQATPSPSGSEVTAASTSAPAATTPAASDPPPAAPQPTPSDPTTPADPTPAPPPPATGEDGTHHGRHHGPIGQLLHDLLGLGNVQG
jgi:hypothetical protein